MHCVLHSLGFTAGTLTVLSMYTDIAITASTAAADTAMAAISELPI